VRHGVIDSRPTRRNLRHRVWPVLLGIILGLWLLALGLGYVIIWPGTTVAGISVGGSTPAAAEQELRKVLNWESRRITLVCPGFSEDALLSWDLGVTPDVRRTIATCRRTLWSHLKGKELPLLCEVSSEKTLALSSHVCSILNRPACDASFRIREDEQVEVIPHQVGQSVDIRLFCDYVNSMERLFSVPDTLEIPLVEENPRVFSEDLEAFLPLVPVAQYSTEYLDGNDRAHNIGLASRAVSNIVLYPGDVFSFNLATGPRSKENGYRKAPVIVGSGFVDDYGGGVCQVSTTVYVAMLKANLSVEERHCHGIPVSYVPMGMDATVDYDTLDLKMKNTTSGPCITSVKADGGTLTAKIFGRDTGTRIEIETFVLKEYLPQVTDDTNQEQDDAPRKLRSGYLVETWRKHYAGDQLIRSERLGTSMYPPEKPL
jgi:vancomycin resistance protein YoaR